MGETIFAERLREALRNRKMKPIDLANKTGIIKGTISNYLSGKYIPKKHNLKLISEALNYDETWLLGMDPDEAWKYAEDSINNFIRGMELCGFNDKETDILLMYKELTDSQKDVIGQLINSLYEKNQEEIIDADLQR